MELLCLFQWGLNYICVEKSRSIDQPKDHFFCCLVVKEYLKKRTKSLITIADFDDDSINTPNQLPSLMPSLYWAMKITQKAWPKQLWLDNSLHLCVK